MTIFRRSAELVADSANAETRTLEAIISRGAPVMRADMAGPYREVLSLAPDHVDLSNVRGVHVLNNHDRKRLESILGVVESATVDGKEARAVIRLSERADIAPLVADIRSGIINKLSVGYLVDSWKEGRDTDGVRVKTATRWTPCELSFVPVGADPGATVIRGETMEDNIENVDDSGVAERATAHAQIRTLARSAGFDHAVADELIDRGLSVDGARGELFERIVANVGTGIRHQRVDGGRGGEGDGTTLIERMADGLYSRVDGSHEPAGAAREFTGWRLRDAAADILRRSGVRTMGLGEGELYVRAMASTSDFPLLLANITNKSLRSGYGQVEEGIRRVARKAPSVRDFKPRSRVNFSTGPVPLPVGEGGEYKAGAFLEAEESYAAKRFGRMFNVTIEALVNDDMGAFGTVPQRLGQAYAVQVNQWLVDIVTASSGLGPTMRDGNTVFHPLHANLSGTNAAPTEASLTAARLSMRRQKGLAGEPIAIVPRFLVVPPELETACEKLLTAIQAAKSADVNPFASLVLVVEPRLVSTTRWYLVADPATADGLEYAAVDGMEGPLVETERDFDTDGVRMKVKGTFGGAFVDWRSWHMNPGA